MPPDVLALFDANDGIVTTAQLSSVSTRAQLRTLVRRRLIFSIWHGVYSIVEPTVELRLRGLDRAYGRPVAACLGTAAQLHGFDTERTTIIHVHDPGNRHTHGYAGLRTHQRLGAPLTAVNGRLLTTASWTAVETARELTRQRALATLDAALAAGGCSVAELRFAAANQSGRRGIRTVRPLIEIADPAAQSPMESEARLVMFDGGIRPPRLQLPVLDEWGMPRFFLDFGWEREMVGAEYDSDEFHSGPLATRRDRARIAWLQERGWLIVPITSDDVRRAPAALCARLRAHLIARTPAA